jgi:hypothetical protein
MKWVRRNGCDQSGNRLRETINPVTGLIQQKRKCLAVRVAAYIFRRSQQGRGVRWRGAENTVNLKGSLCIQMGRKYVEG